MRVGSTQQNIDDSEQHYGPKSGWVYIASNPLMPGLLKIGKTTTSVEQRLDELSRSTGVPAPFKLELSIKVQDCGTAETLSHKALAKYRVKGKEFFKVSVDTAVKAILPAIGKYHIDEFDIANKNIHAIEQEIRKRKRDAERKAKAEADARRIAREKRKYELKNALEEAVLEFQQLGAPPDKPDAPIAAKFCNKVADYLSVCGYTVTGAIISLISGISITFGVWFYPDLMSISTDWTLILVFAIYSLFFAGCGWIALLLILNVLSNIVRRVSTMLWNPEKHLNEYIKARLPFEIADTKIYELQRELNELIRAHGLT